MEFSKAHALLTTAIATAEQCVQHLRRVEDGYSHMEPEARKLMPDYMIAYRAAVDAVSNMEATRAHITKTIPNAPRELWEAPMTCPCCERNARLLTTDEYDQFHDEGMSEAVMSETLNEAIQTARENANGNGAHENRRGRPHLRAVNSGGVAVERARAVGELETALNMLACRLEAMAEDRALGLDHDWSLPDAMACLDKAYAAASLPLWPWRLPEPAPAPVQFKQAAE